MIPKKIFTIWLNENLVLPELVQQCLETHKLEGFEHQFITLENCFKDSRFLKEALEAKMWVKAVDYLRMHYLFTEGGIYLDADVKVLKPLDQLLDAQLFVGKENNKIFSNAVVGSIKGHWLLGEYLRRLDDNFRGDGDLVFESGVRAFCDLIWISDHEKLGIKVYEPDVFYPYNHETGEVNITDNTLAYHYFTKTWK